MPHLNLDALDLAFIYFLMLVLLTPAAFVSFGITLSWRPIRVWKAIVVFFAFYALMLVVMLISTSLSKQ